MSAYIEDGSGNNENGEVRPIMTGSFHFRVCSKCSVNWVLIQNNADHTESVAVCDKCNETTSLSKTYVEIKCEDKRSVFENHVKGETVSTCTSSNYPHANIEDKQNNNNVSDNLQLMECAYLKSMSTVDNIHAISASQIMDKHSSIYVTSTESNVNYVNDMISESVADDLFNINNVVLLESVDAAKIAKITMKSDEIIVKRKEFEFALAKTSDDDDISSEKTTNARFLGISDTLKNVQDIKPEMFLRPAQYRILQSDEDSVTAGERSLPQKEEKFCKIDDDPVNNNPSNDHVSQTNMEDQYPDATLQGSTPDLLLCRVDDFSSYSTRKPCCHQCRVCPKEFRYTSALARHERTHFDSWRNADRLGDKKHVVVTEACSDGNSSDCEDGVSCKHDEKKFEIFQKPFQHVAQYLLTQICSLCDQRFAGRDEILKHERLHKPDPNEKCGICQKIFGTEFLLKDHYRAEHRDRSSRLFTCNICPYTTKNTRDFICHVRVHTGVKPFVCTLCDTRFVNPGNLRKHIKIFHSKIFKYVCSECGKGCKDKRNLKNHKRVNHHRKRTSDSTGRHQTVCSLCFQPFADRMEMIKHKQLHKPDPSEKCDLCHKVFGTELLLREHYRAHHRDGFSWLFTCNSCSYTTMNASNFICHVRSHTGVKPYVCIQCDRRFVKPGTLREHVRIIHSKIYKYVCSECGKGCRNERDLERHKRVYHIDEPMCVSTKPRQTFTASQHVCSFCLQQFADRIEMIKHQKLHRTESDEKCDICQERFDTELLLREHYRAQHRDRTSRLFTCIFCSYTTKNAHDFISHLRMHTGVKPYVCTQCDGRFVNSGNLREHIQFIHSKIFKYVCSECGKGCRDERNLRTHKRVHHSGEQMSVSTELQQTCSFCFQQFADRMEMIKHQQLHKPDLSEKCGVCQEFFDTELLLKEHYRAEHRDGSSRLFTCNSCPYTTKSARDFICHLRMHTGVKPYVCTLCDIRFVNSGNLREHITILHSKLFKYVCSECGKGCNDKTNLRIHKSVHHSGEQVSVRTKVRQTASALRAESQHAIENKLQYVIQYSKPQPMSLKITSKILSVTQETVTSYQDEVKVIKTEFSQNECAFIKYDDTISDSSSDDHISQTIKEVQHPDGRLLKYSTPDIIPSRIEDDLYSTRKPCYQCRVGPKIFQRASALARHERTHSDRLAYVGRLHDRRHVFNEARRDGDDSDWEDSVSRKHCDKKFETTEKLAPRVQVTHSNIIIAQQTVNDALRAVDKHLEISAHDQLTHACSFCDHQLAGHVEIMKREPLHKSDSNEKCGICLEVFDTELLRGERYKSKHCDGSC